MGQDTTFIDGFQPDHAQAFRGYSPETTTRVHALVEKLARKLRVEVAGIEKIPRGRALIVANHAFGFDVAFPMCAVLRETGRHVWALGEHAWWRFPFLRRAAAGVGIVDGTPDNADRL